MNPVLPATLALMLLTARGMGPSVGQQGGDVESIRFVASASRVDWSGALNQIAFDRIGADGYYDVFVGLNSANERCLTCGHASFPAHAGGPAWHPSGAYFVFQGVDPDLEFLPADQAAYEKRMTAPGWGVNNNLWIMRRDGAAAWQLTHVAAGMGTLHSHFDAGGARLLWSEKISYEGPTGRWTMKVADVVWESSGPQLRNVVDVAPLGVDLFYETHGYVAGDAKIIFSAGDPLGQMLDIYVYDLSRGELSNLTSSPDIWDEHAHVSPDGTRIIWASSRDVTMTREYFLPYLDYWIMDVDGSNKRRLTYFNEPSAPEYYAGGAVTGDFSWAPDGRSIAGRVELTLADRTRNTLEAVALITLR